MPSGMYWKDGQFIALAPLDYVKLDGSIPMSGNLIIIDDVVYHAGNLGVWHLDNTAPSGDTRLNYNGNLYATRLFNLVYKDYAEYFERGGGSLEYGEIVQINPLGKGYIRSKGAYSNLVVGVYSNDFGHCLGGKGDGNDDRDYVSVGLAGRVNVKLVGKAKKGDLLVSSNIDGVAMKDTLWKRFKHRALFRRGVIIGKALEDSCGNEVMIFILNR